MTGPGDDPDPRPSEDSSELSSFGSADFGRAVPPQSPDAEQVGRYRLIERLGQGTFGEVYLAEREDLSLRAAIKLLQAHFEANEEIFKRFEVEREALAQLDHPGITKIYDAGRHLDGRPWYAMEYIAGRPIHQYCDDERLTIEERLDLFREVCEAIQHAHARGVIHRDLKPQHIIVVENDDGSVTPKVIDYGLAKTSRDDVTLEFRPIGTPEYMSPEQVERSKFSSEIDPRPDVFALGTILYELLVGSRPLRFDDRDDFDAVRKVILEQVAPPLSSRFASYDEEKQEAIARARSTTPAKLAARLADDLDRLVAHSIEKDSNLRCPSAGGLASLIGDVLAFRPLPIATPSRMYLLKRFIRRNRAPVIGVGAVTLSLTLGLVISTVLLVENIRQGRILLEQADLGSLLAIDKQRLSTPLIEESLPILEEIRERADGIVGRVSKHRESREEVLNAQNLDSLRASSLNLLIELIDQYSAENGELPDLRRRIEVSQNLRKQSLEGKSAELWRKTLAEIRDPKLSPRYRDLPLFEPQLGLVPLGQDPHSGLHEFWHVASGERPDRGEDGRWVITPKTGIVLVLIPGGRFWMGAEPPPGSLSKEKRQALEAARPFLSSEPPSGELLSEHAMLRESPAHPVDLHAFFIGKFEVTRGQWTRWRKPPEYRTPKSTPVIPITYVRRPEVLEFAQVLLLDLPTEAQWEYAARAGSLGDWYYEDPRDLVGHFNMADRAMEAEGTVLRGTLDKNYELLGEDFSDGYAGLAPVGQFDANPNGLHDVYGNVWEWCAENASRFYLESGEGFPSPDTVIAHEEGTGRILSKFPLNVGVIRGGGYQNHLIWARSAFRYPFEANRFDHDTGFRVARPLNLPVEDER